jgi:hypothetical protein
VKQNIRGSCEAFNGPERVCDQHVCFLISSSLKSHPADMAVFVAVMGERVSVEVSLVVQHHFLRFSHVLFLSHSTCT